MSELKRVLSSVDAAWIVAGSMIGAGIFITPGQVSAHLPGILGPLMAWLLGGIVALCGAAVYGELGARLPRAGGDYQFLSHAYGPLWGFMNGWAAITLTFSAAAAAQSRGALDYLSSALSLPSLGFLAPPIVLLLTWANTIGARVAGRTTAVFTAIPLAALIGIFGYGLLGGQASASTPPLVVEPSRGWWLGLSAAMIPVFFAYSGWNAAAYLAGEMKSPGRSLARGLLVGTGAVTLLYLAVNLILILVLPAEELAGSGRPAAEAARRLLGRSGETLLGIMICTAILGSANVTLMAGARVYYAMAVDGLAPATLTRTNRSGVPSVALWVGGVWSALLALVGRVEDLVGWATLAILLLSSMTVTALFVLRHRDVGAPVFRCPGYPVTPLVFLVASLGAAVASYLYNPEHALIGLGIILAGLPLYLVVRGRFGPSASR